MNEDLTVYDIKPKEFINYLRYYGEHFNKKLYEFACEELEYEVIDKSKFEDLLKNYSVDTKQIKLYDGVFVMSYLKKYYYGKGISDEKSLVTFIKQMLEKEKDVIFVKFIALMAKKGIPIEWEDMI